MKLFQLKVSGGNYKYQTKIPSEYFVSECKRILQNEFSGC